MAKPGTRSSKSARSPAPLGQASAGATMSRIPMSLKLIAVAIGVCALSACASLDTSQSLAHVTPAAKIDNGLGNLPHYRDWTDPTGRAPMGLVVTAEESTR
jgi:hypothetical protein